ncbi:MAG TPA: ABC transporter substrate-binding protein [Psychrobacter sp.]|uniref:ABC transporter substrate-binding protein n=1 Tax=Psychrobacter sp. TaxID=56811 RepID=UPI002B7BCB1B|nr:ABC transporter substrate-binding protein [Psychrobacter sp.]HSP84181.1 ABC transporter substrate-binding protein [Psychrobacter sp.]
MFSVLYQYIASKRVAKPLLTDRIGTTWVKIKRRPIVATLALATALTACHKPMTEQQTTQVDSPNNVDINIVSPDWGNAATLIAMGYPPIATGDIRVWDRWVGTPKLPTSTIDLGIRYQPNAELIAQLPVDMVVDNFFYEHARNLYGDVPAESIMFAAKGDTATWADYTQPTRQLGKLIDEPKLAEDYIVKSRKDIEVASERLQQRYPNIKKIAVVQFADANNMRMYVANSLFQPALTQMKKELVVLGKGNSYGFVPIRMGDLAQLDDDVCLLIIDPLSPITRAEIKDSLVWQRLSYGNNRCVGEMPPVWIYGGMSSLVDLANNLSTVELKGGSAS